MDDIDFKVLEEELAKIDPVELRYLLQLLSENAPVVEKIIQNVLDAPISEETQKRLQPPLSPKPFQPIAPPRRKRRQEFELGDNFSKTMGSRVYSLLLNCDKQQNKTNRVVKNKFNARLKLTSV